jgi:hypothetical protein
MEKLNLKKFENISLKKDDLAKIQGGYGSIGETNGGRDGVGNVFQYDYHRGNGHCRNYY